MKKVSSIISIITSYLILVSFVSGCSVPGENSTPLFEKADGIILTIRDFRGFDETGTGEGFISEEYASTHNGFFQSGKGHPDFENFNKRETGIIKDTLDENKLPQFNKSECITSDSFYSWYRDIPGINKTIKTMLNLKHIDNSYYEFKSEAFFPIDGLCFGNTTKSYSKHNYGFTDTCSFYINWKDEEQPYIYFHGDDDIWIFINNKLAIDMGGCHSSEAIKLSLTFTEVNTPSGTRLYNELYDFYKDDFVEISIFHAERHTESSIYRLRFNGILYSHKQNT